MVTVQFSNKTGKPLELVVEPWASNEKIPVCSTFAIHYPAPPDREDTSHFEIRKSTLVFCCEGSTYEGDVDGERILT